jgi:ubiquinone/menaquinone biosynthesis C-methylase UbiE
MSDPPVDPQAFRQFEHTRWQSAVDQYHDSFGQLTSQTIAPLLDAVEIRSSTSLLDVASGPGYVANAAAQHGAVVVGVDFSAAMIAKARALFPGLNVREGDAEALPFHDDTFDVVVMNFGLLHLGQPEKAISEAYRVLREGGRFGFTVWATPDRAVGFQLVLRAIQAKGDASIPLPQGPPFFRFSDEAECRRVLTESGFAEPAISTVDLTWELSSPEEMYLAFYYGTARTGGLMRAQSAEALGAIKAEIEESAQAYRVPQGTLRLPMPALLITSSKPLR